jgi:hypothetical protein
MRCQQFDKEVIRALQALDFKVEDDSERASMEAIVGVIHPAGEHCLLMIIELPNGGNLTFRLSPKRILECAADRVI